MKEWVSSDDISQHYLGTVLAVRGDFDNELCDVISSLWARATDWLLDEPANEVIQMLTTANPALGTEGYVSLLRDERFGLLRDPSVLATDLHELSRIRREEGAYTPDPDAIEGLATA